MGNRESKDWFGHGVERLYSELKPTCCYTTGLTRVLYIYSWVDELMSLCRDYKKCDSHTTKLVIYNRMNEIVSELQNYKVFDERFDEMFDKGR